MMQFGNTIGKKKTTLLVIDSDTQTQKMMTIIFDNEDYKIVECLTGKQAVRLAVSVKPDFILIDLNLPDMQGIEIIKSIREFSNTPIIVLSARKKDSDVAEALNLGAHDYVFKPFNADVLMARVNVSLRCSNIEEAGDHQLKNGPLMMDLSRHEVFLDSELIAFTPKEYDLLRYFMVNCGKMLSHREILKSVWGDAHTEDTQYLRVFVGQIREKIEINPSVPIMIVTEAGVGYRMEIAEIVPYHRQGILEALS